MKKKICCFVMVVFLSIVFGICNKGILMVREPENNIYEGTKIHTIEEVKMSESIEENKNMKQTENKVNIRIGDYNFTATLEENAAVNEFMAMLREKPITLQLDDYSGFEKVGPLGRNLTTSNKSTTTKSGDIVLYNGNRIVIFYGSNSWSYTRLGRVDDLTNWNKALGSGSITVTFTLK